MDIGGGDRILKKFLPSNVTYHSLDFGTQHEFNQDIDKGEFPIKTGTYDFVLCHQTLEHVMYPDRVIQEMIRVAKKEGIFFFSLPNEYNFILRLYYLLGKKTIMDESFQVVAKHLHIHKPRVKDILELFSKHLRILQVQYIWQSRSSMNSSLARIVDKPINLLAKIYPSMFCRLVSIKAVRR